MNAQLSQEEIDDELARIYREAEALNNAPMPDDAFFDGVDVPANDGETTEHPTADAPLAGLASLAQVALVGRESILAAAAKPAAYAWQDIAVLGTIIVIAGDPGGGKTTLLFLLVAARLNVGAPVALLNREVTPALPLTFFVLIEGEHSEGSTARKLVKSMRIMGVDDAALDRIIIIARKAVRIGSPEWEDVVRLIAAGLVADVALDTLARVAPADGDNEREQVAIFDRIAQAIEGAPSDATKPTVWIVAHTRKNNADGALTDVSGSTQRTGQADTVIMSKAERVDGKVTQARVTFAKLREEPDDYPAPVDFAVTKDGIVYADASTTKEADDRPLEDRILERLALGPRTRNKLAEELGRNKADLQAAVDNLFDARYLRSAEITIRGRTFKGLALRENDTGRQFKNPRADTGPDTGRASTPDDTGRTPDESREGLFHAG